MGLSFHAAVGMAEASEIDIYRSAHLLIKQRGEDAARHAAMRADAFLEDGDMEGRRVWLNIREAIEELQRTRPRRDEATH